MFVCVCVCVCVCVLCVVMLGKDAASGEAKTN